MKSPPTALIEYYTIEEKIFIFIIRPKDKKPILVESSITDQELKCLEVLYGDTSNNIYGGGQDINPNDPVGEDLNILDIIAEKLVHNIIKYLKEYDILCLVPHGWIHLLPLHAMKLENGQYFIEKFKIVYAPSATTIKYCRANSMIRQIADSKPSRRTCLSLGTGLMDDSESLEKSFVEEAIYVGEDIFNSKGITRINEKASKSYFLNKAKNYDVLHIASHGYFDSSNPSNSGLILSDGYQKPKINTDEELPLIPDNMLLSAKDIFGMELMADLVVLSACVTGMNKNRPGDELIGLTRAFFYAGVPSVIVSLWNVCSTSTLQLMKLFYKHWIDSGSIISKAEALQKAQLEMIYNNHNAIWQHPYHWAPFILVGSWT